MSGLAGGVLRFLGVFHIPDVGAVVRIHDSEKTPLAGHTGTIIAVSSADPYGPYLVEFDDGFRLRCRASEFSVEAYPDAAQGQSRGRGLNVLTKILGVTKSKS